MQPLFDMINSLQMTALMGLNHISLPSNAMQLFKILVTIVAFDFFDVYSEYNPGFTATEPYSERLSWFGFGSINYIEDLGFFLGLCIIILTVQTLVSILIYSYTGQQTLYFQYQTLFRSVNHTFRKDSWVREKFDPLIVKQAAIRFVMEAYIEINLAACISFKMFEIKSVWNNWDKFSVAFHFFGIAVSVSFFILVCWFVFYKVKALNIKHFQELKEQHKDAIEDSMIQRQESTVYQDARQLQFERSVRQQI